MRRNVVKGSALLGLCGLLALGAAACSDRGAPTGSQASAPTAAPARPPAPAAPAPTDPVEEGRTVYMGNCIACHNPDPTLDGSLGPAIAGSSRELIEARVLHGAYPEGYTPKRSSSNMIPLPYLRDKIPALAAYLGQAG